MEHVTKVVEIMKDAIGSRIVDEYKQLLDKVYAAITDAAYACQGGCRYELLEGEMKFADRLMNTLYVNRYETTRNGNILYIEWGNTFYAGNTDKEEEE